MIRKIILSILIACILCTSVFASSTTFDITAYKRQQKFEGSVHLELLDAMSSSLSVITKDQTVDISQKTNDLLGNITETNEFLLGKRAVFSYSLIGIHTGTYTISFKFGATDGDGFEDPSDHHIHTSFVLNNFENTFKGGANTKVNSDMTGLKSELIYNAGTSSSVYATNQHDKSNSVVTGDTTTTTSNNNIISSRFSISLNGSTSSTMDPNIGYWITRGVVSMTLDSEGYVNAHAGTYTLDVYVTLTKE